MNRTIDQTSTPLVSIIIPTYNSAVFVAEAIESALRQTYPHCEVVVIDDGSTDDTLSVLQSFGNRIVWKTVPNGGAPKARNIGLAMSHGEYILFLDADDLLDQGRLAIQVPIILTTGAAAVFSDCFTVPMDRPNDIPVLFRGTIDEDPVVAALGANVGSTAALHQKRALLEIGGWREDLPCAQDRDLHLRLAVHEPQWEFIREPLLTMRRRTGSVSSCYLRVIEQYGGIVDPVIEYLESVNRLTPARRFAFARFFTLAAINAFREGGVEMARRYFARSHELDRRATSIVFSPTLSWVSSVAGPLNSCRLAQLWHRLRLLGRVS